MKISKLLFTLIYIIGLSQISNAINSPKIGETDGLIKVMVIDSGIDRKVSFIKPYLSKRDILTDKNYNDANGHGTAIASTILYGPLSIKNGSVFIKKSSQVCKQVKIISCAYFTMPPDPNDLKTTLNCYKEALIRGVNIINYSGGGYQYSSQEYSDILKLQKREVPIIAAAGNDNLNISNYPYYPASFASYHNIKNVYAVGSLDFIGDKSSFSNYGMPMVWEIGEGLLSPVPIYSQIASNNLVRFSNGDLAFLKLKGTSQATAIYTHRILLKKCNEINRRN